MIEFVAVGNSPRIRRRAAVVHELYTRHQPPGEEARANCLEQKLSAALMGLTNGLFALRSLFHPDIDEYCVCTLN